MVGGEFDENGGRNMLHRRSPDHRLTSSPTGMFDFDLNKNYENDGLQINADAQMFSHDKVNTFPRLNFGSQYSFSHQQHQHQQPHNTMKLDPRRAVDMYSEALSPPLVSPVSTDGAASLSGANVGNKRPHRQQQLLNNINRSRQGVFFPDAMSLSGAEFSRGLANVHEQKTAENVLSTLRKRQHSNELAAPHGNNDQLQQQHQKRARHQPASSAQRGISRNTSSVKQEQRHGHIQQQQQQQQVALHQSLSPIGMGTPSSASSSKPLTQISSETPKSKYRGVSYKRKEQKWVAQIKFKGIQNYLGIYKTQEDAARAYDTRYRELYPNTNDGTNFQSDEEAIRICDEAARRKGVTMANIDFNKKPASSKYRGVSFKAKDSKFVAQIRCKSKQHYLGIYESEEEAAHAYDKAAREMHGTRAKLNFPHEDEKPTPEPRKSNNPQEQLKQPQQPAQHQHLKQDKGDLAPPFSLNSQQNGARGLAPIQSSRHNQQRYPAFDPSMLRNPTSSSQYQNASQTYLPNSDSSSHISQYGLIGNAHLAPQSSEYPHFHSSQYNSANISGQPSMDLFDQRHNNDYSSLIPSSHPLQSLSSSRGQQGSGLRFSRGGQYSQLQ